MKDWKKILISPSTPILKAIEIIDANSMGIVLAVDENNKLLGTVTDGDVRRAILSGLQLTESVSLIMNKQPTAAKVHDTRNAILTYMRSRQLKQIPIVDDNGCVIAMEILDNIIQPNERENWVVLMAGGLGKRLYPLTNDCPKPLLKVGDKPILETILENFIDYGFRHFYISVNYKAEMIEKYFDDGSRWGAEIRYLREKERMGTAGALSLISDIPQQSLLVMNGDLLTKVNFEHLLNFHSEHKADATMCVREYKMQVPYGVVKLDDYRLNGIVEKPVQQFFVSAGVYVLEPYVLNLIPHDQYFDMPSLFQKLISQKYETAAFPVREYWLDIGRTVDFEKANGEFSNFFG